MSLVQDGPLQLVTFDGDVTLYNDGHSLTEDNPVIPRILTLLSQGIRVGIVTAAGYSHASKYYFRLYGLLEAIKSAAERNEISIPSLIVLGGESNYLFTFDITSKHLLTYVPRKDWMLEEMKAWTEPNVSALLDVAEAALRECITNMQLPAEILRKERAVGIIPKPGTDAQKFTREQLEETVLVTQQVVEMSPAGKKIPFCAFNGKEQSSAVWQVIFTCSNFANNPLGGNDVFVDIGDKSWGVLSCQKYLGGIEGSKTLHIGDQFLSAGANDFKARLACTTAWIASPAETVELLDELVDHIHSKGGRVY